MNEKILFQLVDNLRENTNSCSLYIPFVSLLNNQDKGSRYVRRFRTCSIIFIRITNKSNAEVINDLVAGILAANRIKNRSRIQLQVRLTRECSKILFNIYSSISAKPKNIAIKPSPEMVTEHHSDSEQGVTLIDNDAA